MQTMYERYHRITGALIKNNLTITTMESCSGGILGLLLSDREGASAVVPGGFFTYANASKIACGVPQDVIESYGVYSAETACAMAAACKASYHTAIGIGVTGSIGTVDPNNADSVPGEVFLAVDGPDGVTTQTLTLTPDTRHRCRLQIADAVADILEAHYVR